MDHGLCNNVAGDGPVRGGWGKWCPRCNQTSNPNGPFHMSEVNKTVQRFKGHAEHDIRDKFVRLGEICNHRLRCSTSSE